MLKFKTLEASKAPENQRPKVFSSYHYLANLSAGPGVFLPVLQEQLVSMKKKRWAPKLRGNVG